MEPNLKQEAADKISLNLLFFKEISKLIILVP